MQLGQRTERPIDPPAPAAPPPHSRFWRSTVWFLLMGAVLFAATAIRVRLLNMPLERDEGEYAYGGQLLLQGIPLYENLYTMKWPGTHTAYAAIMGVFGQTAGGIHMGLLLVTLATASLVYLLARRAIGEIAGTVAAGTYALLALSPALVGLAAHATHFVMLPALGGILILHNPAAVASRARLISAGLLLGVAALMKQPGIVFGAFVAFWMVFHELLEPVRNWRRLAVRLAYVALGGLIPFAGMLGWIIGTGTMDAFWLWTFQYSNAYAGLVTFDAALERLKYRIPDLFGAAPGLWTFGLAGLVLAFRDDRFRRARWLVSGLFIFSFLAVCPGWYFRGHYFLLLVPATAVLAGVAFQAGAAWLSRRFPQYHASMLLAPLLVLAAGHSLYTARDIFFQLTPAEASIRIYSGPRTTELFPEAVKIGNFLKERAAPNARVAVIGSEPELYFYSRRRSATGYIYMYPLMEPQPYARQMHEGMIRELQANDPEYCVLVMNPPSWMRGQHSETLLLSWFFQYRQQNLKLIAYVEILPGRQPRYEWSPPDGARDPQSACWMAVYEKKATP